MSMLWRRILLVSGLTLTALGCQTMGADYDQPARIINPTEASRDSLRQTVSQVLHTEVTLADDALTDSSVLTIEHRPPGTMQNPTPDGRILDMPIQFRLVINQSNCILIDQRDRSRHTLNDTACVAE